MNTKQKIGNFINLINSEDKAASNAALKDIIDGKIKDRYTEARAEVEGLNEGVRLSPVKGETNAYTLNYGNESQGYVTYDQKGFMLNNTMKGQPTSHSDKLKDIYGRRFGTKVAMIGTIDKIMAKGDDYSKKK